MRTLAATHPRFEQDLKLLPVADLEKKYGVQDWKTLYAKLERRESVFPEIEQLPVETNLELEIKEVEVSESELPPPPYTGQAFGRFVMIRRLEEGHSGRLVMPSRISGTSDVGWVASIGEECKYIKSGEIVLFDQFAGVGRQFRLVDSEGIPGTFLLVEEPDILARLKKV